MYISICMNYLFLLFLPQIIFIGGFRYMHLYIQDLYIDIHIGDIQDIYIYIYIYRIYRIYTFIYRIHTGYIHLYLYRRIQIYTFIYIYTIIYIGGFRGGARGTSSPIFCRYFLFCNYLQAGNVSITASRSGNNIEYHP